MLSNEECKKALRSIELEAYSAIINAFRAQGTLTKDRKKILQELRAALSISIERHSCEVRRAINDEKLTTIAESIFGPNTVTEWNTEARRVVPLKTTAFFKTAFTEIADWAAKIQDVKNSSLPLPREASPVTFPVAVQPANIEPAPIAPPPAKERPIESDGSFEIEESVFTVAPMKPVSPSNIEEIVTPDPIDFQTLPFQDASEPKILSTSNTLFNPEQVINIEPGLQESITEVVHNRESITEHSEVVEDDKGSNGQKFYKSRTPIKNQYALEKAVSKTPILQSPKKTMFMKIEPDTSTSVISSGISSPIETEVTVSATEKNQDSKNSKSNDARSPVSKKPRLHERSSTEKAELSEDDIPSTIRGSGRRGSFEIEESVFTVAPMKPVSPSNIEEIVTPDPIDFQTLPFQDASEPKILSTSNTLFNPEQVINIEPGLQESITEVVHNRESITEHSEVVEDDKGSNGQKFYKSRTPIKNQYALEKAVSKTPILQSPKKTMFMKIEPDTSTSVISSGISSPIETEVTVSATEKNQDSKNSKSNDARSPVSKKPRLHERSSTEKAELSEDDIPSTIRGSGRRGKKGCGRTPKSTPVKQSDPKDQYEFSESTEENSVCYPVYISNIARSKEESRLEDLKLKSAQDSEDAPSNASSPTEKKLLTPTRSKQGKTPVQAISVRKSLFTSDEERMSDSVTYDEASNHQLSENKLEKWEETCEKKGDIAKTANESLKQLSKALESPKKKFVADKRNSSGKSIPGRKDIKISSPDMEDLSAGSRDSEEMSSAAEKGASEEKIIVPPISLDMEVEANDSEPSSSNAAESDKETEVNEESVQGSTDFSPPATVEIKDEKDTPQFGKQDWLQGVSPKSSEPISQRQTFPRRSKRINLKKRETPEYKAWKKAISIVLREASRHKNAHLFLQKVTNDVAPGYLSIVHRPMDLSLIKKNIDDGIIRTTEEFHRDMLIMFQNAIMYNTCDTDVHQMAVEMQQDVLEQIEAFVLTQANVKNEVSEPVSNVKGPRKSQKGKQTSSSIKIKEETDKD